MSGDPYWNSVQALWFNDNAANGSTTFTDQSQNNFTLAQLYGGGNNVAYTNATAPTGMTTSAAFTTSPGRALWHSGFESAWAFSGDYTIEFFIRFNGLTPAYTVFDFRNGADGRPAAGLETSPAAFVFVYNNAIKISGSTPSDLTWHHYAMTRSGSSVKMFLDGTQSGSTATDSTSFGNSILTIGDNFAKANPLNGWMCSFRVTKGVARYTTTFTPPSLPLPVGLPPTGGPFPHYINDSLAGGLNAMRERVRRFISLPSGILAPRPGIILPRGC